MEDNVMKRKLLASILIIVLAILMCAIFVACDNVKRYKFNDDMSREEIVEAINNLDNFTYEYYRYNGLDKYELDKVFYIGHSFYGIRYFEDGRYSLTFVEDNRIYEIRADIDADDNFSNE